MTFLREKLISSLLCRYPVLIRGHSLHNCGHTGNVGGGAPSMSPTHPSLRFSWQTKPTKKSDVEPQYPDPEVCGSYGERRTPWGVTWAALIINKVYIREWWRSHLQSEGLPAHVLQQRRGGAERALRTLLQGQGHDAFIGPQRAHQVTQLPAHLRAGRGRGGETITALHSCSRPSWLDPGEWAWSWWVYL